MMVVLHLLEEGCFSQVFLNFLKIPCRGLLEKSEELRAAATLPGSQIARGEF